MTLPFRFALLTFALLTVLLGGIWLFDRLDREDIGKLRADLQKEREVLVGRMVELTSDPLRVYAADYSPWDELVTFVAQPTEDWARTNLDGSLDTHRVDAVWILRPDFSEVYGAVRAEQAELKDFPCTAEMVRTLTAGGKESHFFVQTAAGLLELRGAPIRPSDQPTVLPDLKPSGWLFAARRWNEAYLTRLAGLLDGKAELTPAAAPVTLGTAEIVTTLPLRNWRQQPLAELRTTHVAPALYRAETEMPKDLLILCAYGVIALLTYSVATHAWVIRPLRAIGLSLQQRNAVPLEGLLRSGREFGVLGEIVADSFQQEEKLRQIYTAFNAIDDAVIISDQATGLILHANLGATRLLGYEAGMLEKLALPDLKVRPKGDSSQEIWLRCQDGRFVEVDIREQPLTGSSSRRLTVMVARDISNRLKVEQQRLRAQRLESLGTLAGGVAHDMNNMLTPILLMLDELDEEKKSISPALLASVRSSVKRGATILRQLLSFGHGFEGERVALDLGKLVEEIGRIIASTFPKSFTFETRLARQLPRVIGDATQVHQVLLNLCVNARDAMPAGGTIAIAIAHQAIDATNLDQWPDTKAGNYALIEVRDTGSGIPPEIIDRIFDPFFTTKPADRGTGLGLSTTLGIIRGHGGSIKVRSSMGKGTCFSILLPASEPQVSVHPQPVAAVEAKPVLYQGDGRTVLVIEDEAAIRDLLRRMLGRMAFKVIMASHGQEGLDLFRQHEAEINLVITDLNMPGIDGLTVLRTLRATAPTLPLLVMSGRLDEPAVTALKGIGITGLIDKPFSLPQILERVQQAVAGTPARPFQS